MTAIPIVSDADRLTSLPTPVLVTQHSEHVWVAKLLAWAGFAVEGSSRADALLKLDQQVKAQLAEGEIAYLDVPLAQAENPWLAMAEKSENDPNWDEYLGAIEESRRLANSAEGIWLEGDSMA